MKFLHYQSWLNRGDEAVVTLDKQANVQLMDDSNFAAYKARRSYRFFGGLAKASPVRLAIPNSGHWNVIVDLGGYSGSVSVGCHFITN